MLSGYIFAVIAVVLVAVGGVALTALLRKVVPTNMVHIVQTASKTLPYGKGKEAGNVYLKWPSWVPFVGVTVTEFPESIFEVKLADYDAYDQKRLPFKIDVVAFFRVENAETAALRVATFSELQGQLAMVLQGAVRRILGTNELESIMEDRSKFGKEFTDEVGEQIREWGVCTVKMIEFMDIRDAKDSQVIANMMAKEKSRIEKESRIAVAANTQEAQLAEIDARRKVEVQQQDAAQQVGLRTAEKEKTVGIAKEKAAQEVQELTRVTAEKEMAVERVRREKEAEIAKQVAVTEAEASKATAELSAAARLTLTEKEAAGVEILGKASAEAERLKLLAPVEAQTALAKEIGDNEGYQSYLITLEQIKASQEIGTKMAEALANADLKIISSAGDGNVMGGVTKLSDLFTVGGGTKLSGMLAALSQTEEGKAILGKLTSVATP